jgi:short-subunit dehydrogenase
MSKFSFKDKNVLITGASGGLGSAMVKFLADWKARLVLTSRSENALKDLILKLPRKLESKGIDIINIYPGTVATAFEENAFREEERPGLCPKDRCGRPRFRIAQKVLEAAAGPPGEVWLERAGKWFSTAALVWPSHVDRRLATLRDQGYS